MEVIIAVEYKWYMTDTYIFGIIVYKLGHWQEPGPIILLKIYKGLEVDLYYTVITFCLFVNLGVECYGKLLLDAKEIVE